MNHSDLPFGIIRARRGLPPLNHRRRAIRAFRYNIITVLVGALIVIVMHAIAVLTK